MICLEDRRRFLRDREAGRRREADTSGGSAVFNVFNHANYGSYTGTFYGNSGGEVASGYQQPSQNANLAYAPRTLQLGFRVAF